MNDQSNVNEELSTQENKGWKISYNAKTTLTFCLICILSLGANMISNGIVNNAFSLQPEFILAEFYRMFSYIFCHQNFEHFLGNILFILMLGPILEEKYGSKTLIFMILFTAVITGIVNVFFFYDAIIGASGIVFMFIILSSIVNMKSKEIPLTFIFIVCIYLGREILHSFEEDNVSQFGHIFGGICGGALGFIFNKG